MKTVSIHSDEQLLQRIKCGDRKAFENIYKKYWPRLFDAAYKRIKSKEAAEEIIQELFTYIWCKRQELQLTHSFSTYIYASLKYKILNYIRAETIKNRYVDSVKQTQPHFNYAVDESILYNELNGVLEKEINNLPERCRQVFNLRRKENLSFKEIATKLDISINTVEKQVGKALKILRANLKDYMANLTFLFYLFF